MVGNNLWRIKINMVIIGVVGGSPCEQKLGVVWPCFISVIILCENPENHHNVKLQNNSTLLCCIWPLDIYESQGLFLPIADLHFFDVSTPSPLRCAWFKA